MKKKITCFLLAAGMLSSFAACQSQPAETSGEESQDAASVLDETSAADSTGEVQLDFWNLLGGGDGETMAKMIKQFNDSQDEYTVKGTTLEWGNYYTKLKTSVLAGESPTFAISHYPYVPSMAKEGLLVPMDDYADKLGYTIEYDQYAGMIEDMKYEDHYYAVPLEQNIVLLYYNKELCKAAGLLDEKGELLKVDPTIDAFSAMLDTAKESIGGGQPLIAGEKGSPPFKLFASMYYQNGGQGQFVNEQGEWVMDKEIGMKAMGLFQQLYTYNLKNVENTTEIFTKGETPFLLGGCWDSQPIVAAMGDNVGVAATPQFGPEYYTHVLGHSFVLPINEQRTDEEVKGVLEFIQWFAQHNDEWSAAGSLPAYLPAAETELFKSYPLHKYFSWAGDYGLPLTYNAPFSLSGAPECLEPLGKLARGETTPEQCFTEMQQRMETALS